MSTGMRMKSRRKELGLSADYVAKELNVDRSTIFRYERGDIEKLPLEILEPLSQILRTTPAYLMGWEDNSEIKQPKFTIHEISVIQKYRSLDEKGRHTVNTVLEMEYNRNRQKNFEVVAAHSDDYSPEQIELMRKDLDQLDKL